MEIPEIPKNPIKFYCELCDYTTSNKKDFAKHESTAKHKNSANGNKLEISEIPKTPTYTCNCNKIFATNSGLWKHKQLCHTKNSMNNENITSLTKLVLEVVKSNNELQKQNHEFQKQLIDVCKTNITNNSNTVNSHNKTFNLQVFLNEDCKDAMNVSDFMNSLNLQVSDLECVGQLGFVEGISNIIIKRLNAMDITKRPVHCTDSKRETIYIKEDGVWTKDDDDNMKIRKLVRGVSSRNCKNATAYKAMYPEWKDPESKHSYIYDKIVLEAFGGTNNGKDEENENKIIRKILKHLTIDKTKFS
jgi:hypothetical protein